MCVLLIVHEDFKMGDSFRLTENILQGVDDFLFLYFFFSFEEENKLISGLTFPVSKS